jgi:dTDP-4-amino-4,6-dideoxygalactose transaminase
VITTPFSFFATAESISNLGAKVVFADIEASTYNIDPQQIRAKISSRTKAIMPVHLYGQSAAMGQIRSIAQEYGLKVIEDCAQSFGAKYEGKAVGTIGDVGAFSFFPSKNLGCYGDGGMIVTDDQKIAEVAGMLRVHGAKKKYHNEVLGYNSRLDTIQAAILRVKLQYIDEWNQGRRRVAEVYNRLLADVEGVVTPGWAEGHVFHQYTVRIAEGKRDQVQQYLTEQGIGSMIYYPIPQDQLPVYKGQHEACPVSDLAAQEVLSLPIWPELEEVKIQRIVSLVKQL